MATVLVVGIALGRLLNPYAIAASSMISHSCKISDLVAGTETSNSSSFTVDGLADRDIRVRRSHCSCRDRDSPVAALMYDEEATVCRAANGGEM